MIESYQAEVARKQKAARIFWLIVFTFAGFLYFFFQGYYPDVRLGVKQFLGTSGSTLGDSPSDLIKSFGIINISVKKPTGATISLGSGSYVNNDKLMTNYGEYTATISKVGYISDVFDFVIDRESPYYISIVSLLRAPTYARVATGSYTVRKIGDTSWIQSGASGSVLLDESFSGGIRLTPGSRVSIGEGYFLSGKTIMTYNTDEKAWEPQIWSGSSDFIADCSTQISVRSVVLSCDQAQTVLTDKWRTLTGILAIGRDWIRRSDRLLTGDNLTPLALTGAELQSPNYIERDGNWYSQSGATFVPLRSNTSKKILPPIVTDLDTIEYVRWVAWELIIIGKKGSQGTLAIMSIEKNTIRYVTFPDTPLTEVRIEKYDGNLFIKTRNALLFLYNDSDTIEWLIDGEILAFSPVAALYSQDGALWRASWGDEE
jgi:hypothetical protein